MRAAGTSCSSTTCRCGALWGRRRRRPRTRSTSTSTPTRPSTSTTTTTGCARPARPRPVLASRRPDAEACHAPPPACTLASPDAASMPQQGIGEARKGLLQDSSAGAVGASRRCCVACQGEPARRAGGGAPKHEEGLPLQLAAQGHALAVAPRHHEARHYPPVLRGGAVPCRCMQRAAAEGA